MGFVAQELENIYPEAVVDLGDHLGVTPGIMIPRIVKAMQELKARVDALQS